MVTALISTFASTSVVYRERETDSVSDLGVSDQECNPYFFVFQMSQQYCGPIRQETDLEQGGCDVWANHNVLQAHGPVNTTHTSVVAQAQNKHTVNTPV